jgi:hypothetical protein
MIRALGYSHNDFDPARPGRLCRGREQWVRGWEEPEGNRIARVVISGAIFTDDSARDAKRGLTCAGVDLGALFRALFGDSRLLAFKEEGELAVIPDYATRGESWLEPRAGGRWMDPCERWRAVIEDPEEAGRLVAEDLVDGFVHIGNQKKLPPELEQALFLLTAHGDDSKYPLSRFQPLAMPAVLEHVDALVCVHQDKHGPALGIYTKAGDTCAEIIEKVALASGCLPVPFAIPPMLARWDRALYELRMAWMNRTTDEFPVPPAPEASRWAGRRPVPAKVQAEE